MSDLIEIRKLLPTFEEKFLHKLITNWGRQWTWIDNNKRPKTKKNGKAFTEFTNELKNMTLFKRHHLEDHFSGRPLYGTHFYQELKKNVPVVWGSYGISLNLINDIGRQGLVKSICYDADSPALMDLLHFHVMPWLDEREIDYLFEYSGHDGDRGHLWVLTEGLDIKFTNQLFEQIHRDSGVSKEDWFNEQYPYGARKNNLIRLPFGFHGKHMEVFLGEYKGKPLESVLHAVESMCSMTPLTQEKLLSYITAAPIRERRVYQAPETLIVNDNFQLPTDNSVPEVPRSLSSKCLAIHRLIEEVKNENKLLNNKEGLGHMGGLCLSGMYQRHDVIHGGDEGRQSFQSLVQENKDSDPGGHNWEYYWDQGSGSIWQCETMDKTFGWCDGCQYKDRIKNPMQLYKTEELVRRPVGEVRVLSLPEIRAEIFPKAEAMVRERIDQERTMDLVIEAPMESGKSFWADKLAAQLANEGKRIAIACNSIDVALEHKERVEGAGAKAFIMGSFESLMEKFANGLICPNEQGIKDCRALGIPSTYYKKKYCKECPFNEECPFPNQYTQVQEDCYPVVIIQHAHFACEETIRQLFSKKQFDVLIIDENFQDFLIHQLMPTEKEIELLKGFEETIDWAPSLVDWLIKGGKPTDKIEPRKADLAPIHRKFSEEKEPYRLPDFLRCYRNNEWYDKDIGIMKFIPIPECPIRIILDATASMEELKIILNNPYLKSVGAGIVADPLAYNKKNEVHKLLDGSASKTQLLKKEVLYEYLEFIGDKMMNEYEGLTALITVFKEAEQDAFEWLIRNYPSIIPRIAINHMAVGTNQWADFNVQFLVSCAHLSGKMYKEQVYRLKFIYNYWRRLEHEEEIRNPYPCDIPDNIGVHMEWAPTYVINEKGIKEEFPQFLYRSPDDYWENMVYRRVTAGKFAQSFRVRYKEPGKQTLVWLFDNTPLYNIAVSHVHTIEELLSRYRE